MTFVLTKKIENDFMTSPIIQSVDIEAISKKDALEKITVSNEHRCNLRNQGQTHWIDSKRSLITLTLKEKEVIHVGTSS